MHRVENVNVVRAFHQHLHVLSRLRSDQPYSRGPIHPRAQRLHDRAPHSMRRPIHTLRPLLSGDAKTPLGAARRGADELARRSSGSRKGAHYVPL